MNAFRRSWRAGASITAAALVVLITISLVAGPSKEIAKKQATVEQASDQSPPPLTSKEARRQARTLQTVYESSLHMMHHYYFDDDEGMRIPAKALEDVFAFSDAKTGWKTYWISVNSPPMNVDNKPDTPFEKKAAKALTAGQEEYDHIANGKYYRAGAITLTETCMHCHVPALTGEADQPVVAGLMTIIPIVDEQK